MSALNRRYSTGLKFLDYKLDGGVPAGKLLAFIAPAQSQSELLLYHLATSQPVLYISTMSPSEGELREAIDGARLPGAVDLSFEHATPTDLLDEQTRILEQVQPESYVVVDPVDSLERGEREQYLSFLNALKVRLREVDSVGVLHGLDAPSPPKNRHLTLQRSDCVWRLEQLILSREIKTRLLVTKARGGRALTEPIPLVFTDQIQVDTTRRIA